MNVSTTPHVHDTARFKSSIGVEYTQSLIRLHDPVIFLERTAVVVSGIANERRGYLLATKTYFYDDLFAYLYTVGTDIISGQRPPLELQELPRKHDKAFSTNGNFEESDIESDDDSTELQMRTESFQSLLADLYRLAFKIRNMTFEGSEYHTLLPRQLNKERDIDQLEAHEESGGQLETRHSRIVLLEKETSDTAADMGDTQLPAVDTETVTSQKYRIKSAAQSNISAHTAPSTFGDPHDDVHFLIDDARENTVTTTSYWPNLSLLVQAYPKSASDSLMTTPNFDSDISNNSDTQSESRLNTRTRSTDIVPKLEETELQLADFKEESVVDDTPISPTEPVRVRRARGRPRIHPPRSPTSLAKQAKARSKTGCTTCRKRKKKCDETKPYC
jgi:hypothetical protein